MEERKMGKKKSVELEVGMKIGHLTLLERFYVRGHNSKGRFSWKCQCECTRVVVRREDLFNKKKNMHCGCLHSHYCGRGKSSKLWKGHGDIPGQYWSMTKHGAATRKLEFSITIEYAWDVFLQQEKRCAISGFLLEFCTLKEKRHYGRQQTASLDRIDSTKGYIVGNVQWVHKDVNMMKREYQQDRFIEVAIAIAHFQEEKERESRREMHCS